MVPARFTSENGYPASFMQFAGYYQKLQNKGSVKNNLVEFAPKFAVDLIDLIEQNRRNSELFRGLLRMKIG